MSATEVSVYRYSSGSPWNRTDQIGVDVSMWRRLYPEGGSGTGRPVFVSLGGCVVGRVRPDPALNWEPGRVEVPEWMWLLLGAPDSGAIFDLDRLSLQNVSHLTLRPRRRTAAGGEDPVATLTAELCNGRWACLSAGMELVLDCGVWDVLRVVDVRGEDVLVGCILDQDVTVELEIPLDDTTVSSADLDASGAVVPVAPVSPVVPVAPSSSGVMTFPGMLTPPSPQRGGYTPFSGTGYRLGN